MTYLHRIAVLVAAACLPLAAAAGTISGTVRSVVSGQPVAATVDLLDVNGGFLQSATFPDGLYQFAGLAAGGYHVSASAVPGDNLALELWPGAICYFPFSGCDLGQVVNVTASGTTTADFSLDTLGSLAGRVVDAETGQPVTGGLVHAVYWDGVNHLVLDSNNADSEGRYQIRGMQPGGWRLTTFGNPDHIERILGGPNCEGGCDAWGGEGTTLGIALNQAAVAASDLALAFGPGIGGFARREGTAGAGFLVDIFDENGDQVDTVATVPNGRFRIAIAPGTYYVASNNGQGEFVDEVYSQFPCPDGPSSQGLCNPLQGDPVTVSATLPAPSILFDLKSTNSLYRNGFETGNFVGWSLVVGN